MHPPTVPQMNEPEKRSNADRPIDQLRRCGYRERKEPRVIPLLPKGEDRVAVQAHTNCLRGHKPSAGSMMIFPRMRAPTRKTHKLLFVLIQAIPAAPFCFIHSRRMVLPAWTGDIIDIVHHSPTSA
jgi:hypothetical protein